jgi:hypothetical protein
MDLMARLSMKLARMGHMPARGLAVLAPFALLALSATSVAAFSSSSTGQLYAFGDNHYGQLGSPTDSGSELPNPTPELITLPDATGPVTEAATGADFSLVLTSTGQVYSFGGNLFGQLGTSTYSGTETPNSTPTLVDLPGASGPVIQIAAGGSSSFALTSTGQLFAFGVNYYGQLGRNTNFVTNNPNPVPEIVSFPGGSTQITQISASPNHTLAVTTTGQLYAFGEDIYGELGDAIPPEGYVDEPILVPMPDANEPVAQVAAGAYDSLVLTATGQLYAFGENAFGQLGNPAYNGTGVPDPNPAAVVLPGATGPVSEIAAGSGFSLAATSTGQLFAFGDNEYGQLGSTANNGVLVPSGEDMVPAANSLPTLVNLPGESGPVVQVSGGGVYGLAVTATGQLYGFGNNYYGQLGTALDNGNDTANPTATVVGQPAGNTINVIGRGPAAYHTLEVVSDLAVLNGPLASGQVGSSYSTAGQAAGGVPPYTWSAAGLPAGLSINATTGLINGVPTSAGGTNVTLTVTDGDHTTATSPALPLTIAPGLPLTIAPAPTPRVSALVPKSSVKPFVMYFEGVRVGNHLRLNKIFIIGLTAGDKVSYVCSRCKGKGISATETARHSTLAFPKRGLIVTARSRLTITVTAKERSRRIRVYAFTLGGQAQNLLKRQQCFAPSRRAAVPCSP